MKILRLIGTVSTAILLGGAGHAQFVQPTSYVATPGADPNYPDSTGHELTDGILGLDLLAYSNASEASDWVAWQYSNNTPSITFQFSGPMTFSRIEVGMDRHDGAAAGLVPSITVAGNTFNFTSTELSNNTRGWLVMDGTFATNGGGALTLALAPQYDQWLFIDEVRFTAIPEPAETAALIGAVLIGATLILRRRAHRFQAFFTAGP